MIFASPAVYLAAQSTSHRMLSQVMLPLTPLTPCGRLAGMNSTSPTLIGCDSSSDDLSVHELSASRQRAAALEHDPHVNGDGVHERRLGVGDPADVDVELAAFDHPQRLELFRVHVLEVLRQLLLRNRHPVVGWRLLQDDGALTGAWPPPRCANPTSPPIRNAATNPIALVHIDSPHAVNAPRHTTELALTQRTSGTKGRPVPCARYASLKTLH